MKTSNVYIDIFIVGILNAVWLAFGITSFLLSPTDVIKVFNTNSIILLVVVGVLIYGIGIIFDYINSWLFSLFRTNSDKELFKQVSIVNILSKKPELSKFIDNHYSRLRIARAIVINVIPITFFTFTFISHDDIKIQAKEPLVNAIIILGLVFFLLSIFSYSKRNAEYKKYISDILKQ